MSQVIESLSFTISLDDFIDRANDFREQLFNTSSKKIVSGKFIHAAYDFFNNHVDDYTLVTTSCAIGLVGYSDDLNGTIACEYFFNEKGGTLVPRAYFSAEPVSRCNDFIAGYSKKGEIVSVSRRGLLEVEGTANKHIMTPEFLELMQNLSDHSAEYRDLLAKYAE